MPTWDEICNPVPNNWGREGAKGFIIFQLTSSYSFGKRLINMVPMFTYDSHYLKWTPIYQPSKIPLIRPVNGQPAAPINDANPPPAISRSYCAYVMEKLHSPGFGQIKCPRCKRRWHNHTPLPPHSRILIRLTDALRNAKADPAQGCCPKVCWKCIFNIANISIFSVKIYE